MGVSPCYTIHQYTDQIYKVVAFKGNRDPDVVRVRDKDAEEHTGVKLDSAFSRARSMCLQYALCNPWEWFFTGTLDKDKMDRYDLDTYAGQLSQWIRDRRKVYGCKFQVLLVPEQHKNGAWHMHGLVHALPVDVLSPFRAPAPRKLVLGGFYDWPDYRKRFGFCSLARIRNPVATAYYVTKYIHKDMARRREDLGKHLYFHSRPLRRAVKASEVYAYHPALDDVCTHDYEYCKVGMIQDADWSFPYLWDGADYSVNSFGCPLEVPEIMPGELEPEYEQGRLW